MTKPYEAKMIEICKYIIPKVKEGIYTAGRVLLISALLANGGLAQEGTIEEKVNGEIFKPTNISLEKEEEQRYKEISDKVKDKFMANNPLCSKLESGYYSVWGKDNLYELFIVQSNKKPEYFGSIKNAIEGGNKKTASAWGCTIEDIDSFNASVKYWGDDIYSFLLETIIEDPRKKFEIEMPVENGKE